jgi:hypothetical protein
MESDRPPDDAAATARNDQDDGECDRDRRHGNGDQRCEAGVRQRKRDGERHGVRDGEKYDDLTPRVVCTRRCRLYRRWSLLHRFSFG